MKAVMMEPGMDMQSQAHFAVPRERGTSDWAGTTDERQHCARLDLAIAGHRADVAHDGKPVSARLQSSFVPTNQILIQPRVEAPQERHQVPSSPMEIVRELRTNRHVRIAHARCTVQVDEERNGVIARCIAPSQFAAEAYRDTPATGVGYLAGADANRSVECP